ncbi:hypothetical protein VT84_08770 [Gemmata sp. SH-PL17]|nr:hypothetical protein VT84_08770 [Gemmata sp. SH-PL17]
MAIKRRKEENRDQKAEPRITQITRIKQEKSAYLGQPR